MTAYNHEKYICEAIESILNQTFKDFELIIVNDGSTDKTHEIIRKFDDPRIVYISQENQGPSAAANAAFSVAKGKYVALMSGDDVCFPQRLEKQYDYLSQSNSKIVFSWVEFIDDNSNIILGEHYCKNFFNHPNRSRSEILRHFFIYGNYLNAVTAMLEREVLVEAGFYHLTSIQLQDFDLWLKLLNKYDLFIIPEKLLKYRIRSRDENLSASANHLRINFEHYQILKSMFDGVPIELFKEAFSDQIKKSNFRSGVEYELEKAFLYLNHNSVLIQNIGVEKLFKLLQTKNILATSKSEYGFGLPNLYKLTSNIDITNSRLCQILQNHIESQNREIAAKNAELKRLHNNLYAFDCELEQSQSHFQATQSIRRIHYPPIELVIKDSYRPLWSVMIPTYNPNPEYLEKTLRSILEQDLGVDQMQIEVIDDRSTQNDPEELVRKVGQGISFYRQPKNLGLIGNWNACISRARGHLVHILHQDDVVKPGFYRRLEAAFVQEPSIGAAFCRYFYMDEKGCERDLSLLERETPGVIPNWIERIAVMQRIECPSIVVKREVYEKLGGFCQEAHYAADWEMWKRIAAHYSVWYEPELLASYRSHSSSETSRLIKSGANIADTLKAIEISQSYLPTTISTELSNQARENCAFKALNIARHMLSKGDVDAAIAQIREGIKSSQSSNTILSVLELVQEIVRDSYQYNLLPIDALKLFLSAFQQAFQKQEAIALIESLKLRETNFIIFPDWSQPEDILYQDLASAMTSLMNHPDINQTTLLLDRGKLTEEEATLFVSGVVMNFVMEEGLDVADELEISLVGQLNEMQWEVLSSRINARIVLEHENKQAIAQNKVEKIPTYEIPCLGELTSILN